MGHARVKNVDLVPRNKSTLICVLFVVVYYCHERRKGSKRPTETAPAKVCADGKLSGDTGVYVPGEAETVTHMTEEKADADYLKFSKLSRPFGGEVGAILSILIPSYRSKILRYLVFHVGLLGMRTYLSLIVANLDGRIVRNLIAADGPAFVSGLIEWLVLAIPASYTNGLIRFLEGKISLEFRKSLVSYVHDLYIAPNQAYYKANGIDGALDGIDHYITNDITRFSSSAAKLYANLGKPTLDLFVFSYQLSKNLGRNALVLIFVNYIATAAALRYISPSFGKLAARGTKLEGYYRNAHSRIITNAEEIAFYDGATIEKKNLKKFFGDLIKHLASATRIESLYSVVEGYVLKYSWSASGYLFASIPVYLPSLVSTVKENVSDRGGDTLGAALHVANEKGNIGKFITNKRIMMSISDAGGRIMYSIKDLAELAGYTRRVYKLLAMLHRVRKQAYHRSLDHPGEGVYTLADVNGHFEVDSDERIRFNEVPVVVPGLGSDLSSGEVLLNPLTFEITANESLLIIGSNGTGKSSIARLAAGMWPVYRGLLQRSRHVSFLPQRPYFSYGTLRDQVIYPLTYAEFLQSGFTDSDLMHVLERVRLEYLPGREGGFDVLKEWKDVFSGGEKQRMLFARVLFCDPKFAVIDEGTSAVSADMEGLLYEECKAQGITLVTISHRISLLKYHDAKLEVGLGNDGLAWSLDSSSSTRDWSGLDKEIELTQSFLDSVDQLTARRAEIVALLKK